jgi:hypothetical protein
MSGRMKVWVVNHPFPGRRWCQARIREAGSVAPPAELGFVWAEWDGPQRAINGAIVPIMPDRADYNISNVDPLVFGPRMYFDYCGKGRKRPPNRLEPGDLVLFACRNQNKIVLDTVFSIGAYKQWPQGQGSLPDWQDPGIGLLARRVHYHSYALTKQHAEVREPRLAARSYRGASDRDDRRPGEPFSWVPWATTPRASPFEILRGSTALEALQSIYRGMNLLNGFKGSFSVKPCEKHEGARLFSELVALARSQGFGVAAEVALASDEEEVYEAGKAKARACRPPKC